MLTQPAPLFAMPEARARTIPGPSACSQGFFQMPSPVPSCTNLADAVPRNSVSTEGDVQRLDDWAPSVTYTDPLPQLACDAHSELCSRSLTTQQEHKRLRQHWSALEKENRQLGGLLGSWQNAYRELEVKCDEVCGSLRARVDEITRQTKEDKRLHLEEKNRLRQENDALRESNATLKRRQLELAESSATLFRQNETLQEMLLRAREHIRKGPPSHVVGAAPGTRDSTVSIVSPQVQALEQTVRGMEKSRELMESELEQIRLENIQAEHKNRLLEVQLERSKSQEDDRVRDLRRALQHAQQLRSQSHGKLQDSDVSYPTKQSHFMNCTSDRPQSPGLQPVACKQVGSRGSAGWENSWPEQEDDDWASRDSDAGAAHARCSMVACAGSDAGESNGRSCDEEIGDDWPRPSDSPLQRPTSPSFGGGFPELAASVLEAVDAHRSSRAKS